MMSGRRLASCSAVTAVLLLLIISGSVISSDESLFPRFVEPVTNVTVTVGRDALLACVVEDLRGYKVAWVRVDTQTILSIHHNIITQNARISLSYNDHRSWYLHIKNVQEVDRGWYMCQVNTDPMRSRKGYLQVVVPPVIIDNMTSTDMVVREGTNVTMVCRATGYPEPYVMWRREDGQEFNCNGESVNVVDGENLTISKVSRLHMGAYLCIASNGVPPSISKRVVLMVQFPPMLSIPNQLEAAYIGQDVTLECHTEAYPSSINYWTTDRGDMIISGNKYITSLSDDSYSRKMKLTIRRVSSRDFSSYRCVAKNSLGETDGLIRLDEIPAPSTTSTTDNNVPTFPQRKKGKHKNRWRDSSAENRVIGDYEVEEWKDVDYESTQSSRSAISRSVLFVIMGGLLIAS
ncbi:lachesin [Helicoverpa armigera]|uniref:lachesin n=1 Tax=Helicoverpa armigera TaxID=29058 RepID=UPI001F56667F|nr:lachesin isoform X1 [Helicoverpa armigera]XP_047026131.1 lachesin-like [Helicoverpa zea]